MLDTNGFYWAVLGSNRLSGRARDLLLAQDDDVVISPLLQYELSQKRAKGKLNLSIPAREFVMLGMEQLMLSELPLLLRHTQLSDTIGWHHRDPFDRLLALQAIGEGIPIISADAVFESYGIRRIW